MCCQEEQQHCKQFNANTKTCYKDIIIINMCKTLLYGLSYKKYGTSGRQSDGISENVGGGLQVLDDFPGEETQCPAPRLPM